MWVIVCFITGIVIDEGPVILLLLLLLLLLLIIIIIIIIISGPTLTDIPNCLYNILVVINYPKLPGLGL